MIHDLLSTVFWYRLWIQMQIKVKLNTLRRLYFHIQHLYLLTRYYDGFMFPLYWSPFDLFFSPLIFFCLLIDQSRRASFASARQSSMETPPNTTPQPFRQPVSSVKPVTHILMWAFGICSISAHTANTYSLASTYKLLIRKAIPIWWLNDSLHLKARLYTIKFEYTCYYYNYYAVYSSHVSAVLTLL